jgi:putative iron-dependent peroxidase
VTQQYLHDLQAWNRLESKHQEVISGRTKFDDVEVDDAGRGEQKSHKTLTTVEEQAGAEYDILRKNMPHGSPAADEFGTYFIGCSRQLWVVGEMLKRIFVEDPPGVHDCILGCHLLRTLNHDAE